LFALSYDPVDFLERFATEQGITYDLLSDEGSATIERLGLLNRHLVEQQAYYGFEVGEKHRGLPYPGTIVLDEDGVVVDRLFDQTYRERPSPGVLLRAATGRAPVPERTAEIETSVVKIAASLDADDFRPMERHELTVRLDIAEGWHVYVPPVPSGFTALEVTVGPTDRIAASAAQVPAGHPFTVEGLDESFRVVEGVVEVAVPVLLQGASFLADGSKRDAPPEPGPLELVVEVSLQACSATECLPPETRELRLTLEEEGQATPLSP
jgi:hypothetical protein